MWEQIHDEHLTPNRVMSVLYRKTENDDTFVLFEVNRAGQFVDYFISAQDAVVEGNRVTSICYGWDVLMVEAGGGVRDAFLSSVTENRLADEGCAHGAYTCVQIFHAAQVLLGNEECEGCEVCEWSETIHVPDAYLP